MKHIKIAPSILSANMLSLQTEIDAVIAAGADMLHLDIMDNHYVPNLTIGPHICKQIRDTYPTLALDVHLMTEHVDDLITAFANAGANRISIHPDATIHLHRSLSLIKELGLKVGIAVNPGASIESLAWCHEMIDFVLVMTVNPGFGGQSLIKEVLPKIRAIHTRYPKLDICVDGGVSIDNIAEIASYGANEFVAGAAIFKSENYQTTISSMKTALSA